MSDLFTEIEFIENFNKCPELLSLGDFVLRDYSEEYKCNDAFQKMWDDHYKNFTSWLIHSVNNPAIYDKDKIVDLIREQFTDEEECDLPDIELISLYPNQVKRLINVMSSSLSELYDEFSDNYGDHYSSRDLFFTALSAETYIDHEGLNELQSILKNINYKSSQELIKLAEDIATHTHINDIYGDHKEPGDYFKYHLDIVREIAKNISDKSVHSYKIEIAALLHDIIEDHPNTENLIKDTFGARLYEAVKLLTRAPHLNEAQYFESIAEDTIAEIVKTADRIANIRKLNEISDSSKRKKLFLKYLGEYKYFEDNFHDKFINEIDEAFFGLIGLKISLPSKFD